MKYDEASCPYPFDPNYGDQPTPSPVPFFSNYSNYTNTTPPCYAENDCNSDNYYGSAYCSSFPANGTRTLYVTVFSPFGSSSLLTCSKYPCKIPVTAAPVVAPIAAPAAAPVAAPAAAPVAAPVAAPIPTVLINDPWFCFSGHSEVEVLDQGFKRMDALQIGDVVRTGADFAPVYSFAHYETQRVAEFLQIWTKAARRPLEITSDHLLYVVSDGQDKAQMRPASAVQVGDALVTSAGVTTTMKITAISKVQREGIYAPVTKTGTIVVNGVVASNYIALPAALQSVTSFDIQHWLQHMAYSPYRFYCGATGCRDEKFDPVTGMSPAVMAWLPVLHAVEWTLIWSNHLVVGALGFYFLLVWKRQQQQPQAMLKN